MNSIFKTVAVGLIGLLLNDPSCFAQSGNYFSGTSAGASNTTGDYNAFAGYGAGVNNTAGSLNTSFGFYAGASNQSTNYNTSVGAYAGYFTSASFGENVFVGYRAGFYNSNGFYNVIVGSNAGYSNNGGSYNIIIGAGAGYDNTTGLSNTFIGYSAGANNTTASGNTFVGNLSGFSNTTGNGNSYFGSGSGTSTTTGISNSFFGSRAGYYNSTGRNNSFFGIRAGESTSTGIDNTFIGRDAGRNITTGSGNTAIGNYAQQAASTLSNSTAIGNKAIVRVSNGLVLGSVNGENGATTTVRVGIGTTSPGYLLHVNGTAAKPGGGSWTVASDRNLKKEIQPYKEGLNEILQINPVWFRYNGKAGMPTEKRYVGVIAQEMQKIAPHTVGEFVVDNGEGQVEKYLDYDASDLAYTLVNAIKEMHSTYTTEIQKLKEEIAALKGKPSSNLAEQESAAKLWQNAPNPYGTSTMIRYYVPETAGSAQIRIISSTGQEVFSRELAYKGESEIEVSNQMLAVGTYIYQLIVDGKVVDHKKMILSK
jgi:trimeric autotransporter adhesin